MTATAARGDAAARAATCSSSTATTGRSRARSDARWRRGSRCRRSRCCSSPALSRSSRVAIRGRRRVATASSAAAVAWAVLAGGRLERPPAHDRLRWAVPPAAARARIRRPALDRGGRRRPGAAAPLRAAGGVAFHHYDLVYRPALPGVRPPRWVERRRRRLGRAAARRLGAAARGRAAGRLLVAGGGVSAALFVGRDRRQWARVRARGRTAIRRRGGRGADDRHGARGRRRTAARRRGPRISRRRWCRSTASARSSTSRSATCAARASRRSSWSRATRPSASPSAGPRSRSATTSRSSSSSTRRPRSGTTAYSLWCAREHFAQGVLLCNGDTVHPPEVEERLLAGRGGPTSCSRSTTPSRSARRR